MHENNSCLYQLQGYGEKKNGYIAAQGFELFVCEQTVEFLSVLCQDQWKCLWRDSGE